MNSIELIKKYLPDAVAKIFAAKSKTAILEADPKRVDLNFKQAGEVRLFVTRMDGLADYKRAHNDANPAAGYTAFTAGDSTGTGYHRGNVEGRWETFKLTQDRGVQFLIDEADDEEVAGLLIGSLTEEFSRTKVISEVDAYRFSKLASYTSLGLGNRISGTIGANAIISAFNTGFEWLTEVEVDDENQVIFVSAPIMTLIRNTTELQKRLTQEEYRSKTEGVTFTISKYEGRPIIDVPSSRFYTDIVIDPVNGFRPAAGSKVLNFLIVKKDIAMPVVKVEKLKVFGPEAVQDADGYKINFRIRHDIFVPEANVMGIYAHVSETNATTKTGLLKLELVEGSVTNAYQVKKYFTIPNGLYGNVMTAATAFTLGANTLPAGAKVTGQGVDVVEASATKAYFALVGAGNKVLAITGELTLPKKA